MLAIISLLVVVALSLIVTRVATIALVLTGLSRESARFQARSAFTGSGFTTAESEAVVNHPVRRRLVLVLMLLGNAGIVSAVGALLLSFLGVGGAGQGLVRAGVLVGGLAVLVLLSRSRAVNRVMSLLVEWALRRFTRLDVRDYAALLHLSGDWRVVELTVGPSDWLAERPLRDLDLPDEGVLVLGIQREHGPYLGAPTGGTCLHGGDTVLLYGRGSVLADLDERRRGRRGDAARRRAEREHRQRLADEQREDADADVPAG